MSWNSSLTSPVALSQECIKFYPSLKNLKLVSTKNPDEYLLILTDCQNILQTKDSIISVLNTVLIVILLVGLVLNLFVITVLLLDRTKTASDVYLLSVAFGDVSICVGTFATSQLVKLVPFGACLKITQLVGNVLGEMGKFI